MSYKLRVSTISPLENRNDLHLTTAGVGHAYRSAVPFPPLELQSQLMAGVPLPGRLVSPRAVPLNTVYETTTGTKHDYKHGHPSVKELRVHKKAPSLLKVNYNLDTINKFNQKSWRRALTMGNQRTETHDKFAGRPDTITPTLPQINPVPATLSDHHSNGPMKELSAATENIPLKGRQFIPQDQAVLDRLEPYMTTNNWYHRTFSKHELSRGQYPRKDVGTYWQCEEYPKAWGHGMKQNPLRRRLNRSDPLPMTDRTVFKGITTHSHLLQPKSLQLVTNALKSQYSTSFTRPTEEDMKNLFYCPVKPSHIPTNDDVSLMQTVPHMYTTTNTTYGGRHIVAAV